MLMNEEKIRTIYMCVFERNIQYILQGIHSRILTVIRKKKTSTKQCQVFSDYIYFYIDTGKNSRRIQ